MQGKDCPHCETAAHTASSGAQHLYPIWNVQCDACCRRVLAFYPENHLSSMNMALIVGMKRGFPFVTSLQRELRDERSRALATADVLDSRPDPHDSKHEDSTSRGGAVAVAAGVRPAAGSNASYLKFRGADAVRRFQQSATGRRVAR